MVSDREIVDITKELLISSFYKYFESKKFNETEHLVLDRIFPNERRITSVMTGLQTSLGSFWEKLAISLATRNGFESLSKEVLKQPTETPSELQILIEETKSARERGQLRSLDSLKQSLSALYDGVPYTGSIEPIQKGRGCDLIFVKDEEVYIIDTKTVQVNAGGGNTFSENLIKWLCYFSLIEDHDAVKIHPRLVFPYNSSDINNDNAWWTDFRGRVAPLNSSDVWVGNEFWSLITDNLRALQCISSVITTMAENSEFVELYQRTFSITNDSQAAQFKADLKRYRIKSLRNVELIDREMNTRRLLQWKHGDCEFRARANQLLNVDAVFNCPSCNQIL